MVKNLPAMWETWVQSLSWVNPLEESKATFSNILAWRIPMDRGGWQGTVHGRAESNTTEQLSPDIIRASHMVPVVKNPPASAGDIRDMGSIPGPGRFP